MLSKIITEKEDTKIVIAKKIIYWGYWKLIRRGLIITLPNQ